MRWNAGWLTASLLVMGALGASPAQASEPECDGSENDCIDFREGVRLHLVEDTAYLRWDGAAYTMKRQSERVLRRQHPEFAMPGHTTRTVYEGEGVRVERTDVVLRNSCYCKNRFGRYVDSESCCGESHRVTLKATRAGRTTRFATTWWFGA